MAIRSDSQTAIKELSSYVIDSKMIWQCRNELNEIGKKNNVFLIWVPGHSGIKENEEANTLAKKGVRMSLIDPEPFCGICIYIRRSFWRRRKPRGKISQGWIIPLSSFGTLRQQDPKDIWILVRRLCRLRRHLLRMGLSETDECRFCVEEEETSIHLVTECLWRETCKSEELASLKPSQILAFIRSLELGGEL